jgi:hypothetical protein
MARGDHILVHRWGGLYSHHGIDCGDDSVIHLTAAGLAAPSVRRDSLETFAEGGKVEVRNYDDFFKAASGADGAIQSASLNLGKAMDAVRGLRRSGGDADAADVSPDAVIARAESRLGEIGFDAWLNNCEHFATWCRTGISNSAQIDRFWKLSLNPAGYWLRKAKDFMTTNS